MKYIIGLLLFICTLNLNAQQNADQRTLTTRVADVLAKFPAADKKQYDANVTELGKLGSEGLQQMVSMLSPEGKGDNTALEYAISAYSSSVMEGRQSERSTAVQVYCNSLKKLSDASNINFIIRQLQLVGDDASLSCLAPYLNNEVHAGPAARAIAQVKSEAAGKLLLASLSESNTKDKASVVEGLGFMAYAPAAAAIANEYAKGDAAMKKAVAYALASIGDPASAKLLHDAAKSEKFRLDNSGATASYISYLAKLSQAANGAQKAGELSNQLLTEATAAKSTNARIAALNLLGSVNKEKAQPLLVKAMSDADSEYRGAALHLAAKNRNEAANKQWIAALKSAKPEAKAQIIYFLAQTKDDKNVNTAVASYLNDANEEVRHAAINAIPSLYNGEEAVRLLSSVLKQGKSGDIATAKAALLRVRADKFGDALVSQIDGLPAAGSAAALDVLASRRETSAGKKVFSLLKSSDTTVSNAAYRALASVVQQNDLPQLFGLLKTSDKKELMHVQNAVTAASAEIGDTVKRTETITSEMSNAAADKRYLFAPTLAAIGGKQALAAVGKIYKDGSDDAKKTVVAALAKNRDARSASMLLQIAKAGGADKSAAVDGYINIIQHANLPADQKVLMLQEAMELATSDSQKKRIIQQAGRNQTYLSLVFVGDHLSNPAVQTDAAFAAMNIALSHPEFNGTYVRELLQKVSGLLKGQDTDYQKEAIRKHLAEMPAGEGFVPLFNGKNLDGWKGLVEDPIKRAAMSPKALAEAQKKADAKVKDGWEAKDGLLVFTGKGENLATVKQYEDFEMLVDWKITPDGDAGIYLRGTPQVQIWDTSRHDVGAEVGSGGLYNNEKNASKPLVVADNPIGEWNNFRIIMKGDKVTVYLNGQLVTDNVTLENFWDRKQPLFPKEQIELQAHGTYVAYRNLYIKELPGSRPFELPAEEKKENFELLFNGTNLDKWVGTKRIM